MEELRVNALLPCPPLVHQRHVQPTQGAHLQDMAGRCPGLGQPLLSQQLAQQACVSTIRFRPLLAPTQGCRVGRLSQMWLDFGPHQLFDDESPARASLDGQRHVGAAREPLQPIAQRWPCGRANLARGHLTGVGVHVIERDLCSVHVKTAYNRHLGTSSSTRLVH